MLIRLATQTGNVIDEPSENDSDDRLTRKAILVHEGQFQSMDGPIEFDENKIKQVVENHNAMINAKATQYGGLDKMPLGAFPPILDQHSGDSNNRVIGRLSSLLQFDKRNIPGAGVNLACVVSDVTFLGKDTVDMVKDGRIYHLSVGIDNDNLILSETSAVIEPACPGAMLLSRVEKPKSKGEIKMNPKSELQGSAKHEKLSQIQSAIKKLSEAVGTSKNKLRLEMRKNEITGSFKKLMASGKLSPAEYKKMDISKLAALNEDGVKMLLDTFESREPVIMAGQRGSTSGVNFSDIGKKLEQEQLKRLKAEVARDITRASSGKYKLAENTNGEEEKNPKKKVEDTGTDIHELENVESKKSESQLQDGMDNTSDDQKSAMDVMQGQIDELNTQLARVAGMVDELMKSMNPEEEESESSEEQTETASAEAK